jgi:hypothetical protein
MGTSPCDCARVDNPVQEGRGEPRWLAAGFGLPRILKHTAASVRRTNAASQQISSTAVSIRRLIINRFLPSVTYAIALAALALEPRGATARGMPSAQPGELLTIGEGGGLACPTLEGLVAVVGTIRAGDGIAYVLATETWQCVNLAPSSQAVLVEISKQKPGAGKFRLLRPKREGLVWVPLADFRQTGI